MSKVDEELEKVTVRLFDGDREALQNYYPSLGYNKAIRTLVRKHLRALDEKVSHRSKINDELTIELGSDSDSSSADSE